MSDAGYADREDEAVDPDDHGRLRERIGMYAQRFGFGLVAIVVVGGVIGLFGSSAVPVAIGYTAITVGAAMALIGGISGGGYANLSAGVVDRMTQARRQQQQESFGSSARHDVDPPAPPERDRLQKGLRPEKNPTAFWTVIGGFVYASMGALLVLA